MLYLFYLHKVEPEPNLHTGSDKNVPAPTGSDRLRLCITGENMTARRGRGGLTASKWVVGWDMEEERADGRVKSTKAWLLHSKYIGKIARWAFIIIALRKIARAHLGSLQFYMFTWNPFFHECIVWILKN